jgi:general secretion pathway protein N
MTHCSRKPLRGVNALNCSAIALLVCAPVGFGYMGTDGRVVAASALSAAQDEPAPPLAANAPPSDGISRKPPSSAANPLWTITLGALSQTLARPLFSPSRRPPSIALPPAPPPPPPAPPREPDHPLLTLLGTVIGQSGGVAVFLDEKSQDLVRLRPGQMRGGWTLQAIGRNAASFARENQEATLSLRRTGAEPSAPEVAPALAVAHTAPCLNGRPTAGSSTDPCMSRPVVPMAPQTIGATRKVRREL